MNKTSTRQLNEVRALLHNKKERQRTGLFVAEGGKVVRDMVAKGMRPEYAIVSDVILQKPEGKAVQLLLAKKKIPFSVCSANRLQYASSLTTPQGMMAVFKQGRDTIATVRARMAPLLVFCEYLQDPGNLGMIVRTCAAFDVGALLLMKGSADIYNPKVVRAASGTLQDIPVVYVSENDIMNLRADYTLWAAVSEGAQAAVDLKAVSTFPAKTILCFGSEGRGISDVVYRLCAQGVRIPIHQRVESLNVGVAVGIMLFAYSVHGKR